MSNDLGIKQKYKKRCNWGFLGLEKEWGKHHFDILNFPNTIYTDSLEMIVLHYHVFYLYIIHVVTRIKIIECEKFIFAIS